jgi:hypothetical protein
VIEMAGDKISVQLSKRAYDTLVGLKRDDEDLDAFVLRLATAARASGFFGQRRREPNEPREPK